MRTSIASYKESLSRIAHEVLDTSEEEVMDNGHVSTRLISQHSLQRSPHANGTDTAYSDEIARYRADIQKLQASESEIKVLSFNYAALLKQKEEQLRDLRQENDLLRKSLETRLVTRIDDGNILGEKGQNTESNNYIPPKVNLDRAFIKSRRVRGHENSQSLNQASETSVSRQNGFDNGSAVQNLMAKSVISAKEHEKLLEEVQSLRTLDASQQAELKRVKEQLDKEKANTTLLEIKLHGAHQLNESSHRELCDLKTVMEKMSDSKELKKDLDWNLSELSRLQAEVGRRDLEKSELLESSNSSIQRLERENYELMIVKSELEVKLNSFLQNKFEKNDADGSDILCAIKNNPTEVNMASKVRELEETLKETCSERDKAMRELSRLKQHLLDKELEDEDKMDEDGKLIEELKEMINYQRAQNFQLESALQHEQTKWEELKKLKLDEFHQSNETIKELKQKLANFTSIIDSKNIELQNLQTALGQYYAESEAKDRFGRELAIAREESAKFSELLKAANQRLKASEKENEEISARLSQTERLLLESKCSIQKLEEDNIKLRHALERSMTTLNRMSLDSDNYVDRRIVIKLLVTYFQRNHNKEVLDLMVRMLGFSEEDKQRIGFAHHSAGKGVVRGVLGLPGRLVGGILGGNTDSASSHTSEHQSFADLWVDFLLKETESRERREVSEHVEQSSSSSSNSRAQGTRGPDGRGQLNANPSPEKASNSAPLKQHQPSEHLDAEFSTVSLSPAPSVSPSPRSRYLGPAQR